MTQLPTEWERLGLRHVGRHGIIGSVRVAENFDRHHRHVYRDIEKLIIRGSNLSGAMGADGKSHCPNLGSEIVDAGSDSGPNLDPIRGWFTPTIYVTKRGREMRAFDMTRDGFLLLVFGWEGDKAFIIKVAHIRAFNALEEALATGQLDAVNMKEAERIAGKLVIDAQDAKTEAGKGRLTMSEIYDLVPKLLIEHPEVLQPAIGGFMAGQLKPGTKQRDPTQPELYLEYRVRREGEEDIWVTRPELTREEKLGIIARGHEDYARAELMRDGVVRHGRALIAEHNRLHPDERITDEVIVEIAPELIEQ